MPITGRKTRAGSVTRQKIWAVPETLEVRRLVADLKNAFQVRLAKRQVRARKWFDTDDWRLYRRNLLLFLEHRKWHLVHLDTELLLATFSGEKCENFRYPWDFPVSRMKVLLEPIVSIRSVLPLVTQKSSTIPICILNQERKTIAQVCFADHTVRENGSVFQSITLKGVRGYDDSFKDVSSFFAACGIKEEIASDAFFVEGVRSTGRLPLDYTSKFSVTLQPEMTGREAMVIIFRHLLDVMRHNEQGVICDLDTEFLHDFRVAIRRTRSGLGQVKEVLPATVVEKVKKDLSWLGDITGAIRDLDVYLLDQEKYMNRLPEKLRPYLRLFFVEIARRRKKEQKQLVGSLRSRKYRQVIDHWYTYLYGSEQGGKTINSRRPVIELAREIISRKYKRVMKNGNAITNASPDEDMHRLRIQCKKLRYTLEFFSSLFAAGEINMAVKQLKILQDNLGMFNDLSVQQDMLRTYLAGLKPGSRQNQELATAIGGLLTNLHHEHQNVRKGFAAKFHHFSSEKNQLLYAKLFH